MISSLPNILPSLSVYSHCEPLSIDTSTHLIGTIVLFRLSTRQKSMVYGPQWLRHGRER